MTMTGVPRRRQNRPRKICKSTAFARAIMGMAILLMLAWNAKIALLPVADDGVADDGLSTTSPLMKVPTPPFRPNQRKKNSSVVPSHTHDASSVWNTIYNCTPTHHACDLYRGILHIESGDFGGAGGTIFFQFIIGQLLYAERYHLLPFVHLDNTSHLVYDAHVHGTSSGDSQRTTVSAMRGVQVSTVQDPRMKQALYPGPPVRTSGPLQAHTYPLLGTGVWNHYFHPISSGSDNSYYCPGDTSCAKKPLVKLEPAQVSPGLHLYAPWAPKIWRYGPMPDFVGQPHLPLSQWLRPQRLAASAMVQKYYRFQPLILDKVNPKITRQCLGLHVRWSDKGGTRRKLPLSEFLPFVQAYVDSYQEASTTSTTTTTAQDAKAEPCVYLATDALPVLQEVQSTWPLHIQSKLIYSQASVRSPNETAVFDIESSHHVTNQEVLRDILELSHCGFLLHGKSAVSESAMYLNPDLIYQSVNLEEEQQQQQQQDQTMNHASATLQEFGQLVRDVVTGKITSDYWKTTYRPPPEWWEGNDLFGNTASLLAPCPDHKNVTLELSPKTPKSNFPLKMWTTRIFVEFWHQLATLEEVVVDPLWHSWIKSSSNSSRRSCVFTVSSLPFDIQTAIQALSDSYPFLKQWTSSLQHNAQEIRSHAHRVVSSLMEIQPHIRHYAATTVFNTTLSRSRCLGLHIPDPGYHRKKKERIQNKYPKSKYYDYVEAYVKAGGKCIYLSTDSHSIWKEFYTSNVTAGATVSTQVNAVRNREYIPAHYMEERFQRLGSEILVEVWNLQSCGIILHGSNPSSEAALFWNPQMLSIHVQDPNRTSLDDFAKFVTSLQLSQAA